MDNSHNLDYYIKYIRIVFKQLFNEEIWFNTKESTHATHTYICYAKQSSIFDKLPNNDQLVFKSDHVLVVLNVIEQPLQLQVRSNSTNCVKISAVDCWSTYALPLIQQVQYFIILTAPTEITARVSSAWASKLLNLLFTRYTTTNKKYRDNIMQTDRSHKFIKRNVISQIIIDANMLQHVRNYSYPQVHKYIHDHPLYFFQY